MHNKLHELLLIRDLCGSNSARYDRWHSTAPAPPTCCCSSPVSAATNGRSSLASSIHRHSHMRKEATARRDVASSIQPIRALSFFCSLLSQAAAMLACVCEWVSLCVCVCVSSLHSHSWLHTHSHTRAAIALYLLVLMALLCVCAWRCVCVGDCECVWLAGK